MISTGHQASGLPLMRLAWFGSYLLLRCWPLDINCHSCGGRRADDMGTQIAFAVRYRCCAGTCPYGFVVDGRNGAAWDVGLQVFLQQTC